MPETTYGLPSAVVAGADYGSATWRGLLTRQVEVIFSPSVKKPLQVGGDRFSR